MGVWSWGLRLKGGGSGGWPAAKVGLMRMQGSEGIPGLAWNVHKDTRERNGEAALGGAQGGDLGWLREWEGV